MVPGLAIVGLGQAVTASVEAGGDGTTRGEEPLRMARGHEPAPPPLALSGRPMGILGMIVQVTVLAVLGAWQHVSLRRPVTGQLVGDQQAWRVR